MLRPASNPGARLWPEKPIEALGNGFGGLFHASLRSTVRTRSDIIRLEKIHKPPPAPFLGDGLLCNRHALEAGMTTIHTPNCWICGKSVSSGNSKIDENHLAVHESCYVAKVALEKGQSQPSTVAKEGPSQPSTPQKPTT
jgi:hypothetical protein